MCGEKYIVIYSRCRTGGSPPRVRGKVQTEFQIAPEVRITPACAGRSDCGGYQMWRRQDHPRGCGEKQTGVDSTGDGAGSPPRVRGEDDVYRASRPHSRITPAGAGRRRFKARSNPRREDHPRGCGEKQNPVCFMMKPRGSPPRVRGEVICAVAVYQSNMDHPRGCGEKEAETRKMVARVGSPPRVRGEVLNPLKI